MKREVIFAIFGITAVAVVGVVQMKNGVAQNDKAPQSPPRNSSANAELPPGYLEVQKNQDALYRVAQGYIQQKKWTQAREKLQEAIAVAPDRAIPPMYSDLAKAQEAEGRPQEALASMRKAFFGKWRGMENHPAELIRYAQMAEKAGQKAEASRAYLQAMKAGASLNNDLEESLPANPTPKQVRALALVASGQERRRKDDLAGAKESFRKALVIDPRCAIAHLNLALSLPSDSEEALNHFNQASRSQSANLRRFAALKAEKTSARIRQRQQKP